jgi:hypothetical protein
LACPRWRPPHVANLEKRHRVEEAVSREPADGALRRGAGEDG